MKIVRTLAVLLCLGPALLAQGAAVPSVDAIVAKLVANNAERSRRLQTHSETRIYRLDYKGFPGSKQAEMIVHMRYVAPGEKEFSVLSRTGSKMIQDRVFTKLLESEKLAATPEESSKTALSPENYNFSYLGAEPCGRAFCYVLGVQPKKDHKFLYNGKIWVDIKDYAVARIEARPAKNPSFWTKRSDIHHEYVKVGEFWFPARNQTVTGVRFGGTAVLTIDYSDHQATLNASARNAPAVAVSGTPLFTNH